MSSSETRETVAVTYCVGLRLSAGLVLMADTRTNAGVDNVSVFPKLFHWSKPGERFLAVMTSGNLATAQAVISLIDEAASGADASRSILAAPSLFQAARLVGALLREEIGRQAELGAGGDAPFSSTLILAGQIVGQAPCLFLIYPEGNFIEAGVETPFFQIGETKYGRPILTRVFDPEMRFDDAVKLLFVSFDSTMKTNLSVGMPLDLLVYRRDAFEPALRVRVDEGREAYAAIASGWGDAIRAAFAALPAAGLLPD
jgi:putative proteasome-type protease